MNATTPLRIVETATAYILINLLNGGVLTMLAWPKRRKISPIGGYSHEIPNCFVGGLGCFDRDWLGGVLLLC
jgi:hypothetical protein